MLSRLGDHGHGSDTTARRSHQFVRVAMTAQRRIPFDFHGLCFAGLPAWPERSGELPVRVRLDERLMEVRSAAQDLTRDQQDAFDPEGILPAARMQAVSSDE